MMAEFRNNIFDITTQGFEKLSLDVFRFQYQNNLLYKSYVDELKININEVGLLAQIPVLPISFFKTHEIKTTSFDAEIIFESSGTTQTISSKHYVKDAGLYKESFTKGFEKFYGNIKDWCIIGLLPSYLERNNSSLIVMVDEMIRISNHAQSGFYLNEHEKLNDVLRQLEMDGQKNIASWCNLWLA